MIVKSMKTPTPTGPGKEGDEGEGGEGGGSRKKASIPLPPWAEIGSTSSAVRTRRCQVIMS